MCRRLLTVLFIFLFSNIFSQNLSYANEIIDTLTSPCFDGRGAVNGGERKAAAFIANEYKKLGLIPFKSSYFQEFNYAINTFPDQLCLKIDDQELIPGRDYIVGGNSSKIKGNFQLICYNGRNLPTEKRLKNLVARDFFSDKFIIIDDKGANKEKELFKQLRLNAFGAAGIILLEEKLTKSLATSFVNYAILKVKKGVINKRVKTIEIEIDQKLEANYLSQNVLGYVRGTEHPDSLILLSAHYDHLGRMGKEVYFPGANDNASGIAMLLNLAQYYAKEPPKKSILFIAFGAEEAGIIGSRFFVEHPVVDLSKINFVFNMDIMGTGDEGVTIVNGSILPDHFKKLETINEKKGYLTKIKKRGEAANSDHYWFTEKGIPAFFMYTLGGIKAYHDVDDIAKTLPLNEFEDCFLLIRDFVTEL